MATSVSLNILVELRSKTYFICATSHRERTANNAGASESVTGRRLSRSLSIEGPGDGTIT
jgi:hypothetical protein